MILRLNQIKAKIFLRNVREKIDLYIITHEVVFKEGKWESGNGLRKERKYFIYAIKPKCKDNTWSGIIINGKISLLLYWKYE